MPPQHIGLTHPNASLEVHGSRLWVLRGGDLQMFLRDGKAVRLEKTFTLTGKTLGMVSDRLNVYGVGSEGVWVVPKARPGQARLYPLKDLVLSGDVQAFTQGSRLVLLDKGGRLTGFDAYANLWKAIPLKLAVGETIRAFVERYGLVLVNTNKGMRLVSTTGEDFKNLPLPEFEKYKDLAINDMVIAGQMERVWFSGQKMVLQLDLKIDPVKKAVSIVKKVNLKPFEKPVVSNIQKLLLWQGRLVLVYDDGLFAYDLKKNAWQALAADPVTYPGQTPVVSAVGRIQAVYKSQKELLVATAAAGVLVVKAGEQGLGIAPLFTAGSLPTQNIHDVLPLPEGQYLVSSGTGVWRCAAGQAGCGEWVAPTVTDLPQHPALRFAIGVARLGDHLLVLRSDRLSALSLKTGAVKLLETYSGSENVIKPVQVLATPAQGIVVLENEVRFFDRNLKRVRRVGMTHFRKGRMFDAHFSTATLQGGRLWLGLTKRFEQPINPDEPLPEEKQKVVQAHPENFVQKLQTAYALDLKTLQFKGFGPAEGLKAIRVQGLTVFQNKAWLVGYDHMAGKKFLFVHNEKTRHWEPSKAGDIGQEYLNQLRATASHLHLIGEESDTAILDKNLKPVAKLKVGETKPDSGLPLPLVRPDGVLVMGDLRFTAGNGLSWAGANAASKGRLVHDPVYTILPVNGDQAVVIGSRGVMLLHPDNLRREMQGNTRQQEQEAAAAVQVSQGRSWHARPKAALTDLLKNYSASHDLVIRLKEEVAASALKELLTALRLVPVPELSREGLLYVKAGEGADLALADQKLRASELVEAHWLNPLAHAPEHAEVVGDELLVTLAPQADPAQVDAVLKRHGLTRGPSAGQRSLVVLLPKGKNLLETAAALQKEKLLGGVELNFLAKASTEQVTPQLPNDPRLGEQWAYAKTGYNQVWGQKGPYQHEVVVAMLDSGVDASHPELKDRVLDGPDFIEQDQTAQDVFGHGTQMAGLIAAAPDNQQGGAGICPQCKILPVRVLDGEGRGSGGDLARAIEWVVQDGRAKVIVVSVSGPAASLALWEAVRHARQSGIVVVASAGNDGTETAVYPAAFPEVIAVGATDPSDALASFSNFGEHVDVTAPGVNLLTTALGGQFASVSGTSAAAALVAGVAGHFLSKMNDATVEQLLTMLYQSAEDKGEQGRDKQYGWGRVNAGKFLAEETLATPLQEYYGADDGQAITVDEELSPELDVFAADGFFKKLKKWFSKVLGAVFEFVGQLLQSLVNAIVQALVAFVTAIGDILEFLYKQILRPILAFYCDAVCPVLGFAQNLDKTGLVDVFGPSNPYVAIASKVCSIGCPLMKKVGIIVPRTRLVCEPADPEFGPSANRTEVPLEDLAKTDEGLVGPFEVILKTGEIFEVENSIDLLQELHQRGVDGTNVQFDGTIIRKKYGLDDALLHAEPRCFRVEYNPYAKFTKMLDTANQVVSVIDFANHFDTFAKGLETNFSKALGGDFKAAKDLFKSLNKLATYIPGEDGFAIRKKLGNAAYLFGTLNSVKEFLANPEAAIDKLVDDIKNFDDKLLDGLSGSEKLALIGSLALMSESIVSVLKDVDLGKIRESSERLHELKDDIFNLRNAIDDIQDDAGNPDDISRSNGIYESALEIQNLLVALDTICLLGDQNRVCDEIDKIITSDYMAGLSLASALYDSFGERVPLGADNCRTTTNTCGGGDQPTDCNIQKAPPVCAQERTLYNSERADLVLSRLQTDYVIARYIRKGSSQPVFEKRIDLSKQPQAVTSPSGDAHPDKVQLALDWDYRDKDGMLVKPGAYEVELQVVNDMSRSKIIRGIGDQKVKYPIAPGELFDGEFDDEILGGVEAESSIDTLDGEKFISFEYDYADKRGAFSVVSIEFQVLDKFPEEPGFDREQNVIWKETRHMPVLGEETLTGYDNNFVWNLRNRHTGNRVDPESGGQSYLFRLVTTMQSGKQYISWFERPVFSSSFEISPSAATPPPEAPPSGFMVRIPHPGQDKKVNYIRDEKGVVKYAVDPYGNRMRIDRDDAVNAAGKLTGSNRVVGATYQDGSKTKFMNDPQFAYLPLETEDPNGNKTTYTYGQTPETKSKVQQVNAPFGFQQTYAYEGAGTINVTDQAGRMTTQVLSESLKLPTRVIRPDDSELSFSYDTEGNVLAVEDPLHRVTTYTYNENNQPVTMTDHVGKVTHFEYDDDYNLTKITDPLNNVTLMTYDNHNNMLTRLDPGGVSTEFYYDGKHRVTQVAVGQGNERSVTQNVYGMVTGADGVEVLQTLTTLLPGGGEVVSTYYTEGPQLGLVKSVKDARNNLTEYTYTPTRQVQTLKRPAAPGAEDDASRTMTYTYTQQGLVETVKDFAGRTTRYTYFDGTADVKTVTEAEGTADARTTHFTYDAAHRVVTTTDPNGNEFGYSYDNMDRVKTVVLISGVGPEGAQVENLPLESYTYHTDGQVKEAKNARGFVTSYHYDALGRLQKVCDPAATAGATQETVCMSYAYDDADRITSVTDRRSQTTTYTYDGAGRVLTVTSPFVIPPVRSGGGFQTTTRYEYDTRGLVRDEFDGEEKNTHYTYDLAGRVKKVKDPLNHETTFGYDLSGNQLCVGDALGRASYSRYDALGRLMAQTVPVAGQSCEGVAYPESALARRYAYFPSGALLSLTDEKQQTTSFAYDNLDRLTARCHDPQGYTEDAAHKRCEELTYWPRGEVKTHTSRRGLVTGFSVDFRGGVIKQTRLGYEADYKYDNNGNLLEARDKAAGLPLLSTSVGYTYDHLDRVISASSGGTGLPGVTLGYTRDEEGFVTAVSGGPMGQVGFTNNGVGLPNRLASGQAGDFGLWYDKRLLPTRLEYPTGAAAVMDYDEGGNLEEVMHRRPNGSIVTRHGYGYDAADRRVGATGSGGEFAYGYDDRDWLVSRTPAGGAADEAYAYDAVGNRTGDGQDYGAGRLNRLLLDDGFTYTYDGDGNLLEKTGRANPANKTVYVWDVLGRLASVILPGGAVVRYRYDVLGRRVERSGPGGVERYVYDGHDLVGVYDAANVLKESYLYGPGIDNVLAGITHSQSGTDVAYYHKDGLNSVTAVSDGEMHVLHRYVYDSFGNLTAVKDNAGNVIATDPQDRFTYTGREWDNDVDLYFYRARWYDAQAGRFISEDPVWDVNLFAYVGNNPMAFVDPMGEEGTIPSLPFFGSGPEAEMKIGYAQATLDPPVGASKTLGNQVIGVVNSPGYGINWLANKSGANDLLRSVGMEIKIPEISYFDIDKGTEKAGALFADTVMCLSNAGKTALGLGKGLYKIGISKAASSQGKFALKASGKTTVYSSVDKKNVTQYIGMTDDMAARASAQLRQKGIAIAEIPGLSGLSRADARAVEQVLIEYHGLGKNGGELINKINSISKKNPSYANSLLRGASILKKARYKGF